MELIVIGIALIILGVTLVVTNKPVAALPDKSAKARNIGYLFIVLGIIISIFNILVARK